MHDVFDKALADERVIALAAASEQDVSPYFRNVESGVGSHAVIDGREKLMLGSGNYLGLAEDKRVKQAAIDAIRKFGAGFTGSRLTNGSTPLHAALETELADWMSTEAAIVFPTGYQTNLGSLAAILDATDTAILDSACHASLVDGCKLSGARIRLFRHNSVSRLESLLSHAGIYDGGSLVIVDGVFSMEGHLSPLPEVAGAAKRAGARLMVDEAHALGVLGQRGAGAAELLGVERQADLRMGTFSKSIGCVGGFIAGPSAIVDYLRVAARAFVFTASSTPADLAASLEAVRIVRSEEGRELGERVRRNARRLREGLANCGLEAVKGVVPEHDQSIPIVSIQMPSEDLAIQFWQALWERDVYTNLAVYPAVPRREPLIRATVSAAHSADDIEDALAAFEQVTELLPLIEQLA